MNTQFTNVYDELASRDLIKQVTYADDLKKLLSDTKVSVYLGIDPTADSIHIGHFIPLMLMSYFQKHGHRPIILVGGGTALIGDPSGKSDMRSMLSKELVNENVKKIKEQLKKFISFEGENKAIMVDNADWILDLNYMDFIRTYGVHFNVNRMLSAECFKQRMEKGLTFFEFNYMLMQSYDFLHLYEAYKCRLEIGGDDQWSNMLAGVELIRKLHKDDGYCMTCPLLLTSDGKKMGKTVKGALWLDSEKTSPYDFYQYFRNIQDSDVNSCLRMLTTLPIDEVNRLSNLEGEKINQAKQILAYEITKTVHGEVAAKMAQETAQALFSSNACDDNMPTCQIEITSDTTLADVLVTSKLASSKAQAKQLIAQGGITVDKIKQTDAYIKVEFLEFPFVICKGKKVFVKIEKK